MAAGYEPVEAIEVVAWGKRVGALAPDPKQGVYVFEYAPAWIATGVQLAPLFMPLRPGSFSFPALPASTYRGLPAMIADGLPDSFGNALIDSFLADKGVSKDSITALDRLAYLGKRADGSQCTIGQRAEFVLELLRGICRIRMETAVKAGQRAAAEAEMSMLTLWDGVHHRFQQELANGTSKDIAAAEIFAVFNKYDEVMTKGENPVRTRHASAHS